MNNIFGFFDPLRVRKFRPDHAESEWLRQEQKKHGIIPGGGVQDVIVEDQVNSPDKVAQRKVAMTAAEEFGHARQEQNEKAGFERKYGRVAPKTEEV